MGKRKEIEVLARGVCVNRGRLLICHTKGAENTYLPGGHVEFGELAKQSLERELKEELGVRSKVGRFLGVVEHSFRQKGKKHCEINLVFEVEIKGLNVSRSPESKEDYIEFKWVPMSRLGSSRIEPAVLKKFLPSWLGWKK